MHSVSFAILSGLEFVYGPVTAEFEGVVNVANVEKALLTLIKPSDEVLEFVPGCCRYMFGDSPGSLEKTRSEIKGIASSLVSEGYLVHNEVDKYHVIAYSLDFCRFEIFCRGQEPTVIKWRKDDKEDPIKGPVHYLLYDHGAVATLLARIAGENPLTI